MQLSFCVFSGLNYFFFSLKTSPSYHPAQFKQVAAGLNTDCLNHQIIVHLQCWNNWHSRDNATFKQPILFEVQKKTLKGHFFSMNCNSQNGCLEITMLHICKIHSAWTNNFCYSSFLFPCDFQSAVLHGLSSALIIRRKKSKAHSITVCWEILGPRGR